MILSAKSLGPILLYLLAVSGAALAGDLERETSYVYPPFKHTLGMNRVGEMELKLFLGPRAKIANPQGLAAVKLTLRDDPKTDRDDDEITLVGVNSNLGQVVYNPSLYAVKSFGRVGSGEGEFRQPRGIDIARDGTVVVADTGNRRLVVLHLDDKELMWRFSIDVADSAAAGRAFSPTDVAINGGAIWCCDHAGGRILRFEPQGRFLGEWQTAGDEPLDGPLAMAIIGGKDSWNQTRRFSLLVVDEKGQRVSVFDKNGALRARRRLSSLISPPGYFGYPVVDLHGQFLLPDSVQGRIIKLDRKLDVLTVVDHIDDDQKRLVHPNSLALFRRFGQLFIAESKGGTYAWTGTDIQESRMTPIVEGDRRGLKLEYRLTEPSLVTVLLAQGGTESILLAESRRRAGQVVDEIETPASMSADAVILLRAKPTYSARKKLTIERRLEVPSQFFGGAEEGGMGSRGTGSEGSQGNSP